MPERAASSCSSEAFFFDGEKGFVIVEAQLFDGFAEVDLSRDDVVAVEHAEEVGFGSMRGKRLGVFLVALGLKNE
jgi:hypothetical protein